MKLGHHQHQGPENQDCQHMIDQPRGSFPNWIAIVDMGVASFSSMFVSTLGVDGTGHSLSRVSSFALWAVVVDLVAPYRAIWRYYRCDTPVARYLLREVSTPPKWCDTPLGTCICAIPNFATYRAINCQRRQVVGKTTIEIKFASFEGGGIRGREENHPKTLFLLGNVMTI